MERYLEGDGDGRDADAPLLEPGIVDSFPLVEITAFAHERFGREIGEDDLVPADFTTPAAFARMIARLDAGAEGAGDGR